MVNKVSWNTLKQTLENIIVSPSSEADFLFATKIKKVPQDDDLVIINDTKRLDAFLLLIDKQIENVLFEINFNEQAHWNINEKEDYFITISEFIKYLIRLCHYDESSDTYNCENIIFSDKLNFFHGFGFYSKIKKSVHMEVYKKYFDLDKKLKTIPDYLSIINKNRKSTSGNKKVEWKLQLNQLVDFYKRQLEIGYIDTDIDNLKHFLINNFTFKDKSLSENTMNTYFDPNREIEKLPKKHKQINPPDLFDENT